MFRDNYISLALFILYSIYFFIIVSCASFNDGSNYSFLMIILLQVVLFSAQFDTCLSFPFNRLGGKILSLARLTYQIFNWIVYKLRYDPKHVEIQKTTIVVDLYSLANIYILETVGNIRELSNLIERNKRNPS